MRDELKSIKKGFTWRDMFLALWHVATVKYASPEQFRKYFPDNIWSMKCGTKGKFDLFVAKGLLKKNEAGVYMATPKTIEFLRSELKIWQAEREAKEELAEWREEEIRYNPDIIQVAQGQGKRDTLYNSSVLLQAMRRDDFFTLFYHSFSDSKGSPWLTPDGILLLKKNGKTALVFLEIEKEKPLWREHIEGKKLKYEALAYDDWIWSDWWKSKCELLKIKHCPSQEFGFAVWCIGEIEQENWQGWQFKRDIAQEKSQ